MNKLIISTMLMFYLTSFAHAAEYLIFGGDGHQEFLGCFNCNAYSSESICNEFGKGNEFSSKSLFNQFGSYGNKFSLKSPWNKFSSSNEVPVVVDSSGNFYGYFTINEFRSKAVPFAPQLSELFDAVDGDLESVRGIFCRWWN